MLVVAPHGLPTERPIFGFEIIGVYDPDSPPPYSGPDGFRQNGVFLHFLHFLHWVIAVDGPSLPSAQQAARALGIGLLQVVDGRAKHSGTNVADQDILGAYQVRDGKIVDGSYKSTFTHSPLTSDGLFQLEPALIKHVLARLAAQVIIEMRGESGKNSLHLH